MLRRMVRIADSQLTFLREIRTMPLTPPSTTMFLPENSAIARITVRMSAPSTSMLKVPSPVRTMPTERMEPDSWAETGAAASAASPDPAIRMRPVRTLSVPIGRIPLLGQRNDHGLRLAIHRQVDDDPITLELLNDSVL